MIEENNKDEDVNKTQRNKLTRNETLINQEEELYKSLEVIFVTSGILFALFTGILFDTSQSSNLYIPIFNANGIFMTSFILTIIPMAVRYRGVKSYLSEEEKKIIFTEKKLEDDLEKRKKRHIAILRITQQMIIFSLLLMMMGIVVIILVLFI